MQLDMKLDGNTKTDKIADSNGVNTLVGIHTNQLNKGLMTLFLKRRPGLHISFQVVANAKKIK